MQSLAISDNQETSTSINWYEKLDKYQKIFTKSEDDFKKIKKDYEREVLRKDRELAALTGNRT